MITVEEFEKVDVRAGTVIDVKANKKSRNPAYVVSIDFGEELGIKKSSAQITALYQPEDLIGKQVICCVNLAPMHIGSVKSEVRILGTDSAQGVVLLQPIEAVKNGDRVFLNEKCNSLNIAKSRRSIQIGSAFGRFAFWGSVQFARFTRAFGFLCRSR